MDRWNEQTTQAFRDALAHWYAAHRRPLPWRGCADPYRIWLSEVMAQQTRMETAVPYYERFVARFPTVEALAAADIQDVMKAWEGLGYYARARNVHAAARRIAAAGGGDFPPSARELAELPGVGPYIAAAVASMAFGEPVACVDANVQRVLARLTACDHPVGTAALRNHCARWASSLLDRRDPGTYNQAVMELGALVCVPAQPRCDACPVRFACAAAERGDGARFPVRRAKAPVPLRRVAVAAVVDRGKLLVCRRRDEGLLGGLWELPGGKLERGERWEQAAVRETAEETGLLVEPECTVGRVRHGYTHFRVDIALVVCRLVGGHLRLNGPVDARWIRPERWRELPFPAANHKLFGLLLPHLAAREAADAP